MEKLDQHAAYAQLAYLLLPESMLFSYDVVNIELCDLPKPDPLMTGWLKIHLEEKDLRDEGQRGSLRPNGFTESRWIDDFPLRDRKVSLCVKRRRYIDADGRNVLLNKDSLVAEGTSYSAEFGAFLKEVYGQLHPGKKRGRKPERANRRFVPPTFGNGDTRVELLTRSRYLLCKSPDKWSQRQQERAGILFGEYPKLREAYWIANRLRAIFRSKIDKPTALEQIKLWYKEVSTCTSRELKAARDTIKARQDEVLNYFVNRATNAAAESLNSKMKGFRSQLRGVADLSFYLYRVKTLFG